MNYKELATKELFEAKENWEKALLYHTPKTMRELVKKFLATKSKAS